MLFGENVYSYYSFDDTNNNFFFPFPPMFAIEAWVKYDLNDTGNDYDLMNIFGKFTTTTNASDTSNRNMKVGFAVANTWMRVFVNNLYYDFDYPFTDNYKWQHISVHYTLLYAQSGSNYRST